MAKYEKYTEFNDLKIDKCVIKIAIDKDNAGKASIKAVNTVINKIDINKRKPRVAIDTNISVEFGDGEEENLINYIGGDNYEPPEDGMLSFGGSLPICSATYTPQSDDKTAIIVTLYVKDKCTYDNVMTTRPSSFTESNKVDADKYGKEGLFNIINATTSMALLQVRESDSIGAWDTRTDVVNPTSCKSAGSGGAELDEIGFMDFATLIEQIATLKNFNSSFNADGAMSIHDYLANNLLRFYHQLYYIPTLKDNMGIVVKPETLFTRAPSCNVIYPNVKNTLSYSRNARLEPTRIMQYTDPIQGLTGAPSGGLNQLITILGIEEAPVKQTVNGVTSTSTRYGMPVYHTYVKSFVEHNDVTLKTHSPMSGISEYEKRNGLYGMKTQKGADMYVYLTAKVDAYKNTASKSKKNKNGNGSSYFYNFSGAEAANNLGTLGQNLGKLARYELLSARYKTRAGSVAMYFNPYIVPGFPFVSLEPNVGGLNVFGYITNVAHNISDSSWSTVATFNCARGDVEYAPVAFPIVEYEWTRGLSTTYKNMLGDTVTEVTNADIPNLINNYNTDKKYTSTSLRKMWRELTSLDDYLTKIADGATIQEEKTFIWLKNSDSSKFFDEELQARIKEYSADVMTYYVPFTENDVR